MVLLRKNKEVQNINNENNSDNKVCKLPKKPKEPKKTSELFFKSLKLMSYMFFIIFISVMLINYVFDINTLYPLFIIGVGCSLVATYFKMRMLWNPNYEPGCECYDNETFTGEAMNGFLNVLEHERATLLFNIPNSVFGIFFYTFMIVMTAWNMNYSYLIIMALNLVSVVGSCWLWYIMVTEVKNICILCTTIHSINFLSFYYLFC